MCNALILNRARASTHTLVFSHHRVRTVRVSPPSQGGSASGGGSPRRSSSGGGGKQKKLLKPEFLDSMEPSAQKELLQLLTQAVAHYDVPGVSAQVHRLATPMLLFLAAAIMIMVMIMTTMMTIISIRASASASASTSASSASTASSCLSLSIRITQFVSVQVRLDVQARHGLSDGQVCRTDPKR